MNPWLQPNKHKNLRFKKKLSDESMIIILDNGRNAEKLASMIRGPKKIIPASGFRELKASAFILSDGTPTKENQRANLTLIDSTESPILGIGLGYLYLVAAFGGEVIPNTSRQRKVDVTIKENCPLLLGLKKRFSVSKESKFTVKNLPEQFTCVASSSDNEFEIIEGIDFPFFGVHFNIETTPHGRPVLNNFLKFTEVWSKYHR
jgi:GMP synthase-like glutamine amidotransferase